MAVLMVPLYLHRAQASGKVSYLDIGHRVQGDLRRSIPFALNHPCQETV